MLSGRCGRVTRNEELLCDEKTGVTGTAWKQVEFIKGQKKER